MPACPPPPRGLSPRGLNGSREPGPEADRGSEIWARGSAAGRAGEEGRREGAWPARRGRALGGGAALHARGSGGSALPRSVHSGGSWNLERSSGPSAATAMRGARGAWDFLGVLLLLLGLQTGGRARRPRGRAPSAARAPESSNSLGCFGRGGSRLPVPVRYSRRKDSRRPWNSPAPSLAHLREEPPASQWWRGCPAGVSREWGQRAGGLGVSEVQAEGAGCVLVWGLLLCRGCAGGSGVRTQRYLRRARRGRRFLLLKVERV